MSDAFKHVLDEVDCYLHDVLNSDENKYVEQHCERCPVCKAALQEAEKRLAALTSLPASEAPAGIVQSTLAAIAQYDRESAQKAIVRRRWTRRGWWLGAAAAMLFLCLHVHYWTMSAAPYDLRVLCQTTLHAGTTRSMRVELVDPVAGTGLENVPVRIEMRNPDVDQWVLLADFNTDPQGTGQPTFRLPDWKDGKYELRVSAQPAGHPQTIVRSVQLAHSWKIMLSSDRPVYQPGQTINLRSLALRSLDLKPIAGQPAVFSVADPSGNIVFKQKEVTSRFGICSAVCPLAREILEGTYTIECQVGDTSSKLQVQVKPYVLPKFKIDLAAAQPYYQPGQRVAGTLHAEYFFGKPVADAEVEFELRGGPEPRKLTLRTSAEGKAVFSFPPLPGDLIARRASKAEEELTLELIAAVTDKAGQAQTRKIAVPATAEPLRVEVILEGGKLVEKVSNRVYFYVHDVIGRPTKARIAFTGSDKELQTSDLGIATFDVMPTGKTIDWLVRATDEQGRIGRKEVKWEPGEASDDFLLRTDKAVYAGGETIHLSVLSAGSDPVFVDVNKDGQTLLTAAIPVAQGHGQLGGKWAAPQYALDLPPELAGTLQLDAYRLGAAGRMGEKRRIVYVRPASQVKIATTLDRPEYKPAGVAKLTFQLADALGKPAPGALSLAAVDEAVFSVLEQSTGSEQAFYTLSPDLLEPVLHVHSWSPPVAGQEEERRSFDQALFALSAGAAKPRERGDTASFYATTYPESVSDHDSRKGSVFGIIIGIWGIIGLGAGLFVSILIVVQIAKYDLRYLAWGLVPLILLLAVFCSGMRGGRPTAMKSEAKGFERKALRSIAGDVSEIRNFFPDEQLAQAYNGLDRIGAGVTSRPEPPRVREWFPETLLWRPELITDDQGRATLDVPLADSITTWRLTASAVTADGRLGASQETIKVFQPFFVDVNLPVALTLGDEVAVPIVVYNYLDRAQDVELEVAAAPWYESQDKPSRRLALKPREVRSSYFRLKARTVGSHELQVTAAGADAVKRRVEVLPGGRRIETVWNGNLQQPADFAFTLPPEAIPGSGRLFLKIYPSQFSQLVEGLDSILRLPSGCFEQTSSTTYPNVLALDYMQRTKKNSRAVEDKARKYIQAGYQRLVGFEVAGGGFDWFGRPPANQALTAYGLMEFQDMAKVYDVDPRLITRTRAWLLKKRQADGSWTPESHVPAGAPGGRGRDLARLSTTAYVASAVFRGANSDAAATHQYLLQHRPEQLDDPHVLALVSNALLAIDPTGRDAVRDLDRLDALKRTSADGKQAWWEQPAGGRTTFYGSGRSGSIETTALTALAFLQSGQHLATSRRALTWIAQQRDSGGTWHSTQATVLALKALLAGTGAPAEAQERRIEWTANQGKTQNLTVPPDQSDVMQQKDLSADLIPGKQSLTLAEPTGGAANFQLTFRYHVPGARDAAEKRLALTVKYDREKLRVGETAGALATVRNQSDQVSPMVVVELPIPAGFTIAADSLAAQVKEGRIAKYEVQALSVLVYLREVPAGKSVEIPYGLRAAMPAQVAVRPARAYEYYNPDREGRSEETRLTVEE
jgi:hypothetical protein